MRFATAISAAIALVGAAAPVAAFDFGNLKCNLGSFWWDGKSMCITVGGPYNAPSPPSGTQCPQTWFWHSGQNCCAPRYLPPSTQPTCPGGYVWNPSTWSCKPTTPANGNNCNSNQFWWEPRSTCCTHGGPPSPPLPPSGNNCPGSWYWHSGQGCCVPQHPSPPVPTCPNGWEWNPYTQCCKPSAPSPPPAQPSKRPRAAAEKRHGAATHH